MEKHESLGTMFIGLVPVYKSVTYRPFVGSFPWDPTIADYMESLNPRRCQKRRDTYLIPGELERPGEAIRFGNVKTGRGYSKERKDFCLVGGSLIKGTLTVFYRRLELIGGLHYDTVLYREVERIKGPIKRIQIMAVDATSFCLKGNSNEALHRKLMRYHLEAE